MLFDDYESQYPYAADGRFPGGATPGLLEPLTALTYLAAVTDRIRLGTGICLVPQRNPVYTAKQVVDLDALSGGRVDFGIGVGWLREEFEAVAAPFEQRGERTDEYLADHEGALDRRGRPSSTASSTTLPPCRMYPKPVQQPHPPIHVGGESDAAMRRVARHGQGWYSFNRLPDAARRAPRPARRRSSPSRAAAEPTSSSRCRPYFNPVDAGRRRGATAERGVDRLVVLCLAFDVDGAAELDELGCSSLDEVAYSHDEMDHLTRPRRDERSGRSSGRRPGAASWARSRTSWPTTTRP